jgi:tRNA pseudouridine55 synthase
MSCYVTPNGTAAETMARKRRGEPVHGWIVIDKPEGMTSARVVARVRAITNAAKAGHAGTLDPLATGVLPIALGEATKTVAWVMDGSKAYRFTVRWGEARDTDDTEGVVTDSSEVRPSEVEIHAALSQFVGSVEQTPPIYSAIKVEGRRSYALARADKAVHLDARTVRIDSVELVECPDPEHAVFDVRCGKGVYVRSLARDLALALGTFGHICQIRRLAAGPFDEASAISLDQLDALRHSAPPSDYLLPVETALDDIPALALTEAQAEHLRYGRPVRVRGPGGLRFVDTDDLEQDLTVCAMAGDRLVALVRLDGDELRPVRVMNH